jgi:hypothetical protein
LLISASPTDLAFHYSFVGSGPGATFTLFYPDGVLEPGQALVLTPTKQ